MTYPELTRRNFIKAVGAGGAMCLCSTGLAADGQVNKSLTQPQHQPQPHHRNMRFYFWNDLHTMDLTIPGRKAPPPLRNERAAWVRSCVADGSAIEPPDFIVSGGDLIHGQIKDYARDFAVMRDLLLDDLPVPFLPCVGNHENMQGEGNPALNAAYDRFFGPGWHNYIFTAGGLGFIIIDNSGGHRIGVDAVTDARLAFVRRALERLRGMPIIVVAHIPLVAMREPEVLAESFGFISWITHDTRLIELIEAHRDSVIAVLSGHLHITAAREHNGIYHLMPSGTAGYPTDFAAFDVFDDRIELSTHAAPAELATPNRQGDIHGRPRHEVDYTDADHPDHARYVCGNADERALSIALPAGKRPDPRRAAEPLQVWHEVEPNRWEKADPRTWRGRRRDAPALNTRQHPRHDHAATSERSVHHGRPAPGNLPGP